MEGFHEDLRLIEYIIEHTGNENETFRLSDMFPACIERLNNMFPPTNEQRNVTNEDTKHGLRIIMFLVLQLCITSQSDNIVGALSALWTAYELLLQPGHLCIAGRATYVALIHHMLSLVIAFEDEPVRMG